MTVDDVVDIDFAGLRARSGGPIARVVVEHRAAGLRRRIAGDIDPDTVTVSEGG